jgi:hypothetical protein
VKGVYSVTSGDSICILEKFEKELYRKVEKLQQQAPIRSIPELFKTSFDILQKNPSCFDRSPTTFFALALARLQAWGEHLVPKLVTIEKDSDAEMLMIMAMTAVDWERARAVLPHMIVMRHYVVNYSLYSIKTTEEISCPNGKITDELPQYGGWLGEGPTPPNTKPNLSNF